MSRPLINPGQFVWLGEHWINELRAADGSIAMLSLYHTRCSAGGEGTVAYIKLPGFSGACTDNRTVAQFVHDNRIPFDRSLPIVDAEIKRGGDIRTAPTWIIQTATDRIEATWTELGPPMVVEGFAPIFRDDMDFFAVFIFAEAAAMSLNGVAVAGQAYAGDAWLKTLGGQRSSSMFALSETMTRPVRY